MEDRLEFFGGNCGKDFFPMAAPVWIPHPEYPKFVRHTEELAKVFRTLDVTTMAPEAGAILASIYMQRNHLYMPTLVEDCLIREQVAAILEYLFGYDKHELVVLPTDNTPLRVRSISRDDEFLATILATLADAGQKGSASEYYFYLALGRLLKDVPIRLSSEEFLRRLDIFVKSVPAVVLKHVVSATEDTATARVIKAAAAAELESRKRGATTSTAEAAAAGGRRRSRR